MKGWARFAILPQPTSGSHSGSGGSIAKWPGEKNPADLCTKGLAPEATARHLATIGYTAEEGRAAAAPELKQGAGRTGQPGSHSER